jgi:hypothetical protein
MTATPPGRFQAGASLQNCGRGRSLRARCLIFWVVASPNPGCRGPPLNLISDHRARMKPVVNAVDPEKDGCVTTYAGAPLGLEQMIWYNFH